MSTPLDICIATCDFVGPIRNGGIGTAYYNMAIALARGGHRVTVLYALGTYCENGTIAEWQERYALQHIRFVPLPAQAIQGHSAIKMSYGVYRWLKDQHFDVVHCHEWRGLGFYTALAKRQGLCLHDSTLCIGAHSPVLWHLEGMNEIADAETLEVDFMERESVARADVLWTPSAHMLAWMRREGWRLPPRIVRKPNVLVDTVAVTGRAARPNPEFVFFGRLEARKGLDLFCDALDRVVSAGLVPARVTFLGKPGRVGGVSSDEYLRARAARWSFPWSVVSDLDRHGAMAYLAGADRVAVLPSRMDNLPYTVLECLGAGIPFLATHVGGIPEMVRARDRDRILFAPTARALAERLSAAIRDGLQSSRLKVSAARTAADWLQWHARAAARPRRRRRVASASTLVSVCVTHRNRPAFLRVALESIRQQDYPHVQVVLVDDGSDKPEALTYLDELEPEFRARRWTLVRQSNRYLGAARNAAIAAARGQYILFMDDDNVAKPHEIRTFLGAAHRTGAAILTCFLDVFQSPSPEPDRNALHVWPFLGGAVGPGLLRNVFGDANAFVRRDVFDRIGAFTEDPDVGCEDWEFFARAVLMGEQLEVVPEPLVMYRQSPSGMLHSTSQQANRMRALRPYLGLLPSHLRPFLHLARGERQAASAPAAAATLDHVQRAVVFGSGEAGRLAIGLAARCGWDVPWIVDNNPAAWNTTAHGLPVRGPESLTHKPIDLVIVASLAGKSSIAAQLTELGFAAGRSFVHFLDPVKVGGTALQLSLP